MFFLKSDLENHVAYIKVEKFPQCQESKFSENIFVKAFNHYKNILFQKEFLKRQKKCLKGQFRQIILTAVFHKLWKLYDT